MSDFEKWFKKYGFLSCDSCKENSLEAWDFQQSKIEKLQAENKLLKEFAREATKVIGFYGNDDTYSKGEFGMYLDDGDCFLDNYVNQSMSTEYGGKQSRQFKSSEIYKQIEEIRGDALTAQKEFWMGLSPAVRTKMGMQIHYGFLNKSLEFYQRFKEVETDIYRLIFKELVFLTKRLGFYKAAELIA